MAKVETGYSLVSIANAIVQAHGGITEGESEHISQRVVHAKWAAAEEAGGYWKQKGVENVIFYDVEHTCAIFDELTDQANGKKKSLFRVKIAPEVIQKAERIMFGIPEPKD